MEYKKIPYEKAHDMAAKVEWHAREKGGFKKENALSLTRDKALKLVKNC
jgi:hypothetical protein